QREGDPESARLFRRCQHASAGAGYRATAAGFRHALGKSPQSERRVAPGRPDLGADRHLGSVFPGRGQGVSGAPGRQGRRQCIEQDPLRGRRAGRWQQAGAGRTAWYSGAGRGRPAAAAGRPRNHTLMHSVMLAPMEGLVDAPMRDILTRIGGIDRCVSQYIRVTDGPLHPLALHRILPESRPGWRTAAGVQAHPQLLGSAPDWLAHNGAWLADLGAPAVDLNFGCPAKTVNRHRGGATLLREPETLYRIVSAMRAALPARVQIGRAHV